MRIGIARIAAETNTFSPILTDLETLQANGILRGQEALQDTTPSSDVPGFLEAAQGEELIGLISAHAMPAGRLTREARAMLIQQFSEELAAALPLDGLLLNLHGAFAAIGDADFEGLVLQRAREIVGEQVPIAAALDLHGNITRRKVETADIIRGYHTHPHLDGRQVARKVAELLLGALRRQLRPVMRAVKIPMITPAETQLSEQYPLRELMEATRRHEGMARVLSSSIFAVQPWLDVPELGWCAVVVTDGDPALADQLARELAALAWGQREAYLQPCPTYGHALDEAFSTAAHPVVISDLADMTSGGGTGDSTWYLRELLARQPHEACYLTMVDPEAVRQMAAAGEGAELTMLLGGKQDSVHSSPVQATGRVERILPPSLGRELPPTMGLAGVLRVGNIYVVVSERMGPGSQPIVYSGAGLDPRQAKVLVAKSVVDFRAGYKGVAARFLLGEAPGLCPSDLRSLKWQVAPRPIFPLNGAISWDSAEAVAYGSRPISQ